MSGSFYQLNQKYNQLLALIQGIPTSHNLTSVLTAGDDAGGLDITNLNNLGVLTINGSVFPPVVADNTLTEVLTAGNDGGALSITNLNDVALATINGNIYPPVVADNTLTVADNNTNAVFYPTFVDGAGASKPVYADTTTFLSRSIHQQAILMWLIL